VQLQIGRGSKWAWRFDLEDHLEHCWLEPVVVWEKRTLVLLPLPAEVWVPPELKTIPRWLTELLPPLLSLLPLW
jgi:hypothetical protein